MKRVLLFIMPIVSLITLAFVLFAVLQARSEEAKLRDELRRKAKAVAESAELLARYILKDRDVSGAMRLADTFQKRERLQGCAIYDPNGSFLVVTPSFADWKPKSADYFTRLSENRARPDAIEKYHGLSVYSYALPVADTDGKVLGGVEVIYDTSYIFTSLGESWKRAAAFLAVLAACVTFTLFMIQRQLFILPVNRLTEWFRKFQKGETDEPHPVVETGELGKLASEVEQVALNLRIARKVASQEATVRRDQEELWTESRLRDHVQARLGQSALVVVSNREPFMHVYNESAGKAECIRPAGGVVTALDPVLRACGGTWVAHGSGNMDRKFVNSKDRLGVPPEDNHYILRRVWLTKDQEQGYYYGFSNEGLWPLCHNTHTRPVFRESDWHAYKEVNEIFARAVVEELPAGKPFVFVQDYHFTLLPAMIRKLRPDATVALFWHIPWPNPEVFSICPFYAEILEGMLACDLIGFHVQNHCNNFLDTVNRLVECRVDTERFSVIRGSSQTLVRPFPISIDGAMHTSYTAAEKTRMVALRDELSLEGKIVGIGVERVDYTKGIKERVYAIDRFLEKYPQYRGRFVFIQIGAPSRTHIKTYHDLMSEIDELVGKVNWKYADGNWKPIVYFDRHFSAPDVLPFYGLADFCIVSSLHDGMNLVAKEYVGARHHLDGVLILSRFTGAARELTDAIQINPYATEEFAEAIRHAVEMPEDEKRKRMQNMRDTVKQNNVYRWASGIITEMAGLRKD
jgi:alpha,alpha-trehalose-phosphate synthase [UDP-forming]